MVQESKVGNLPKVSRGKFCIFDKNEFYRHGLRKWYLVRGREIRQWEGEGRYKEFRENFGLRQERGYGDSVPRKYRRYLDEFYRWVRGIMGMEVSGKLGVLIS